MRPFGLLVLVTCVVAAGCDDNPTGPTNAPFVFSALLSPSNEVPPVTNAESGGRGAVQISVIPTRDSSNAVTGGTATFYYQLNGFPGNTTVVGAHIHPGGAGVNGPVIVNTGTTASSALSLLNGELTHTVSGIAIDGATLQAMLGNPAGYYFNVHSPLNPGGFARGQLQRVQ